MPLLEGPLVLLDPGLDMMRQAWQNMAGAGGLDAAQLTPMSLEDLDRRIRELQTVQNWLQLNATMLANTIQGMEIQRGTLAAIPPDPLFERADWLLGLDHGTVGRAHSAVPLQHTQPDAAVIPMICERYAAQGLAPVFRIPDVQAFDGFAQVLSAAGFKADRPTLTMVSPVAQVQAALEHTGLPPQRLALEITESIFIEDADRKSVV